MAKRINNTPSPDVLMNSMRSLGYSLKTAVADILDNSISAKASNIYIDSPINDTNIFISFLDDGIGMDDGSLLNAMKYGSDRDNNNVSDLGRFGLGLKSASLSQCRILTVASKYDGDISAYQWNLDNVIENKKWDCLKLEGSEIDDIPNINKLRSNQQGTLVVWQNFDFAYKKSGGHIRHYLMEEMDLTATHLRLVFHRFLNRKNRPLKIYINNDELRGFDPFLELHPKTDTKKTSELAVEGSLIKIQPFILPYQNDLSDADLDNLGGADSLRSGQGFYIYRNDRLIIYGTWFRLSSSSINPELYKYGRIKVDIPNTLDEMWEIDIKKQNAKIPKSILFSLKNEVSTVCGRSKEKTSRRARLTLDEDNSKIWNKSLSRNGKDMFYINNNSDFIKNFLDDFDDDDKPKLLHFIDIISSSLPVDDIYNSVCNRNQELQPSDDMISSIVLEGISQIKQMQSYLQKSAKECFDRLCTFEPFDNPRIASKIWEEITHGE